MGFSWAILLARITLLFAVINLVHASFSPFKLSSAYLPRQKELFHKRQDLRSTRTTKSPLPRQKEALKKTKKNPQLQTSPQNLQKVAGQKTSQHTNKTITRHMRILPGEKSFLTISTSSGRYRGFTNSSSHPVETWLGIRYAKPPIGHLRFRAPLFFDKPPDDNRKVKAAYEFGDACPQPPFDPPMDVDISEDCLYLNVYRPHRQTGDPLLPVLLNTDDLPVEDLQVGLKDQITCLKWLKVNIRAFGGDPDKITVWGQSAGAFSVSLLVTYLHNTRNSDLFRAAIMDSGSPTTHTVPEVEVYDRVGLPYNLLVNAAGCSDSYGKKINKRAADEKDAQLECLRELDYDALLNATMSITRTLPFSRQVAVWGPSYKRGSLIDQRPSQRLADDNFLKIPMILGTNKDEGTLSAAGPSFAYRSSSDQSDAYFRSYMTNSSILDFEAIDSEVYQKILELYPDNPSLGSPFGTGDANFGFPRIFKRLAAWFGDLHYQAPRRLWAQKASVHQDVYVYYFDGPPPSNVQPFAGVAHSSELPLIFGNSEFEDMPDSEIKATNELARRMRNRYISFVHDLDPGDDWPAYKPTQQQVMRFNKLKPHGEIIEDNWRAKQLDYINSQAAINAYMT